MHQPVTSTVLSQHAALSSNAYYGVFALLLVAESLIARRVPVSSPQRRWPANITLGVLNAVLLKVLFPALGIGLAEYAATHRLGLFNGVQVPAPAAVIASLLALDLVYYAFHRLEHRVPMLWRFHRVHHCDAEVDVTTGLRHHPVEAVLSAVVYMAAVVLLGAPPLAVFLFLLLEGVSSLWQHGNVRVAAPLERLIRLVFVTPDMHRVHHSAERAETDSNFTILFAFWDRLFGSYRSAPARGHQGMALGLPGLDEPVQRRLGPMLLLPFRPLDQGPA